jgi:hypothetical protein
LLPRLANKKAAKRKRRAFGPPLRLLPVELAPAPVALTLIRAGLDPATLTRLVVIVILVVLRGSSGGCGTEDAKSNRRTDPAVTVTMVVVTMTVAMMLNLRRLLSDYVLKVRSRTSRRGESGIDSARGCERDSRSKRQSEVERFDRLHGLMSLASYALHIARSGELSRLRHEPRLNGLRRSCGVRYYENALVGKEMTGAFG